MSPKDIENLVEKFFSGETSEMEEARLRALVKADDLPDHLTDVRLYFEAMDSQQEEMLDNSFEDDLFSIIESRGSKPVKRRWIYRVASVAAAILILISIWFGTDLFDPKPAYGTIDDPVMAFQETKKVLDEVSKKMNKGLKPAKKTVDKVEDNVKKAGEVKKIDNALKKTKEINKLDKASDFLKSFNKVYVDYGNS
jgi:hypothetical protein